MPDDADLLREYAENGSQEAFTKLVSKRIDLVHSIALRRLDGNRHLAQEVAQEVFEKLAKKATKLGRHPVLIGWLFTSTRFAARNAKRSAARRQAREQAAFELESTRIETGDSGAEWGQLGPIVEKLLEDLSEHDRTALLLRYYDNRSYDEIGKAISLSQDGARMRVQRALEKLRGKLENSGIRSTVATLGALMAENAVEAAPTGLAVHVAIAATAASTAPALTGMISIMSTAKTLSAIAAVVVLGSVGALEWREKSQLEVEKHEITLEKKRITDREREWDERAKTAQSATSASPSTSSNRSKADNRVMASKGGDHARSQSDAAARKRFALFFKQRGLTANQIDQFIDLLNQQADARADLQEAIRKEGLSDGPGVEALRNELYKPISDAIRQLLGDDGYSAYGAFEHYSFYQTTWVPTVEGAFSAANTPLDESQQAQLAAIIANNDHPIKIAPSDLSNESNIDWDSVLDAAKGILSPAQISIFQGEAQTLKIRQEENIVRLRTIKGVAGTP